jgi:hypothetical protein
MFPSTWRWQNFTPSYVLLSLNTWWCKWKKLKEMKRKPKCANILIMTSLIKCQMGQKRQNGHYNLNVRHNQLKSNIYLYFVIWNHGNLGKIFFFPFIWMSRNINNFKKIIQQKLIKKCYIETTLSILNISYKIFHSKIHFHILKKKTCSSCLKWFYSLLFIVIAPNSKIQIRLLKDMVTRRWTTMWTQTQVITMYHVMDVTWNRMFRINHMTI